MAESLAQRLSAAKLDQMSERELRAALAALVNAVQNLATKMDTLGAKLNADATVTDTDYATNFVTTTAAIITD